MYDFNSDTALRLKALEHTLNSAKRGELSSLLMMSLFTDLGMRIAEFTDEKSRIQGGVMGFMRIAANACMQQAHQFETLLEHYKDE